MRVPKRSLELPILDPAADGLLVGADASGHVSAGRSVGKHRGRRSSRRQRRRLPVSGEGARWGLNDVAAAHARAEESARGAKGYAFDRGGRVPSQVRVLPLPPGGWCSDPCCRTAERDAALGPQRRRRARRVVSMARHAEARTKAVVSFGIRSSAGNGHALRNITMIRM